MGVGVSFAVDVYFGYAYSSAFVQSKGVGGGGGEIGRGD